MTLGIILAACLGSAIAENPAADPATQRVTEAVRAHVAAAARVDVADVEIRWLGLSAPIECPSLPDVLVHTRPGEDFRGRTDLRVTLVAGSTECGHFRLPARISIWNDVPVAAGPIRPGETVRFETGRVSRDAIVGQVVDAEAGEWIAIRYLRHGDPVTHRDVRRAPEVLAGATIKLTTGMPGLRITADARMLNDANVGDIVRVANLSTQSVVSGVLVDSDTVVVGGQR